VSQFHHIPAHPLSELEMKKMIVGLQSENAALREALASAENGLRHGLMMEPVDPFQRGKVISWALDTVRAALKKEAQP